MRDMRPGKQKNEHARQDGAEGGGVGMALVLTKRMRSASVFVCVPMGVNRKGGNVPKMPKGCDEPHRVEDRHRALLGGGVTDCDTWLEHFIK